MANGNTPPGGSISQTAAVALPVTGGAVLLNWLVAPSWPPPSDVMLVVIGLLSPPAHLIGRAIYHKLAGWAGEPDNGNGADHNNVNGGASTAPAATQSPSATAVATPSTVVNPAVVGPITLPATPAQGLAGATGAAS